MGKFSLDRLSNGTATTNRRIKFIAIGFLMVVVLLCISSYFRSDTNNNNNKLSNFSTPNNYYSQGALSRIRTSWNRVIRSPLPQCRDVDVDGTEEVIFSFLQRMPGSRREIVHFDFGLIQEHDCVFEMVVPSVKKEQGKDNYDQIADVLSQGWLWERDETEYIARRLHECKTLTGDLDACTFLDVGSNLGWYATAIASMGYNVVAFEANPLLYSVLYSTMMLPTNKARRISRVSQMRLVPYGVGDKFQKCGLYSQPGNFYGSATVKCNEERDFAAYGYEPRGDLFITPADCFLQDVKGVHVMKIDVEGYEIKAMEGMKDLLKRTPPKYIVAEFQSIHQRRQGFTGVQFLQTMDNLGYECVALDKTMINGDNTTTAVKKPMMPFAIKDDQIDQPPDRNMVCSHRLTVLGHTDGI
eukprot:GHVS01094151.1.p1 GENE.GHVS01094151.1~~GHVS01094151.1.p1  ORF type:complete len:413 (-),score=54.13 GHVS01094151.1:276-1514(-)